MQQKIRLSVIIPVYNRVEEVRELLESLTEQTCSDFYVLIVEDGSYDSCKSVVKSFQNRLSIRYFYQENSGPACARNYGAQQAKGNYFIFLDSDCLLPQTYIEEVLNELNSQYADVFGGPDKSHESFTDLQKAINYAMTSFLTTGGIRGGKRRVQQFQPRSFNMGVSIDAFGKVNGFRKIFPGEDSDFILRIWKEGFKTRLFDQAYVYHKRRTSFVKFARQVYAFGKVRPALDYLYPSYRKITFWLPSIFALGTICSLLLLILSLFFYSFLLKIPIWLLSCYFLTIFIDASLKNKSFKIGGLSLIAVIIQFFSYGAGFFYAQLQINLLKKKSKQFFQDI